jgi:hypothetical protein
MHVMLNDNNGNLVSPGAIACDPIAASGITLATGTAGDDKTQTVVGGAIYAITSIGSAILFSITGVTSTAANIEWAMASGDTIIIKIPEGVTTLYYEGDTSSKNAYMRRLS